MWDRYWGSVGQQLAIFFLLSLITVPEVFRPRVPLVFKVGNAEIVLEEFGSGVPTHIHSITNNLSAAAPKDPMANAMSEMMERIKSGNIQLKSVRTVSLIVSRPVSRSRLHAVKPVLSEIIYNCFLVVCRSSIEIFK